MFEIFSKKLNFLKRGLKGGPLAEVNLPLVTETFKEAGGRERFNITDSCERAELTSFLHCFLKRDQGKD